MAISNNVLANLTSEVDQNLETFTRTNCVDIQEIMENARRYINDSRNIINILAEKSSDVNRLRPIGAFVEEEALVLKTILKDDYNLTKMKEILSRSTQDKYFRVIPINSERPEHNETPYTMIDFRYKGEQYTTVFLVTDFYSLEDQAKSERIKVSFIYSLIEFMFMQSLRIQKLPIYDQDGIRTIYLPYQLGPSDTKFILMYHAYMFDVLSKFLSYNNIVNIIDNNHIDTIIDNTVLKAIFDNTDKIIKTNDIDHDLVVELMFDVNASYYICILNLQDNINDIYHASLEENDYDYPSTDLGNNRGTVEENFDGGSENDD